MTTPVPLAARTGGMRSSKLRDLIAVTTTGPVLSLGGGLPPPEAFPAGALDAAVDRVLSAHRVAALQYSPTEGDPGLRELVAAGLAADGIAEASVLVTAGSQQALDLVAKVLLDPGDAVVVESPTYVGALRAMAPYQPRVVEVPVDADGLETSILDGMLADGLRPKLCYVVPNFSNPSGTTMSVARRRELAGLAARYGFLVVEDDPYGQLRFAGEHRPPVASFGDHVLYLGSYSKLLAPGLRVGFCAAPAWLARPLVVAKQAADLNSSALSQRIVVELAGDVDWYAGHVAGLVALYRERARALVDALAPLPVDAPMPAGGMFAWARLREPTTTAVELARVAMRHGVAVVPGDEFSVGDGYPYDLRLSFSMLAPDGLREAVARLGAALRETAAAVSEAGR